MSLSTRATALLAQSIESNAAKIDRFFVGLFLAQWASRIGLAYVRPAHDDGLFTAIFVGALIASTPTMLVVWKPGMAATRHAIAAGQMLFGALLVHLTKGAHQTQIHLFFSLAMLALYRDPMVIVTGGAIAFAEGFAFGITSGLEQGLWLGCTVPVLFLVAHRSRRDLATIARLATPEVLVAPAESSPVELDVEDEEPDSTQLLCLIPSKPPSSRRIDCSILLVEDDVDSRNLLTEHLERAGVSVAFAPNGRVALSEVTAASERGTPFDLVLMDMQMPVMNGYEATAELRRRGYEAPIIAMKGDERRSIDAGCTEYLTTTSRDQLIQIVANHGLGAAATVPPPASKPNEDIIFGDHPDSFEMQELLDGFVSRLHQNAHDLAVAQAARDYETLELIAHRLRGAGGSYGFMAISEAAGALEDAIQARRATAEPIAKLVSLCRRAQSRSFSRAA